MRIADGPFMELYHLETDVLRQDTREYSLVSQNTWTGFRKMFRIEKYLIILSNYVAITTYLYRSSSDAVKRLSGKSSFVRSSLF